MGSALTKPPPLEESEALHKNVISPYLRNASNQVKSKLPNYGHRGTLGDTATPPPPPKPLLGHIPHLNKSRSLFLACDA